MASRRPGEPGPARRARHRSSPERAAAPLALRDGSGAAAERVGVRKTYKLYIGGEFPRTESGRAYEVFVGRVGELAGQRLPWPPARTSATRCAPPARRSPGWVAKTAYNRSQILYRIAELMEGRRDQFIGEVMAAEGVGRQRAARLVNAAIDRWVWYAGWADKFTQLMGTVNPVGRQLLQLQRARAERRGGCLSPPEG